MNNEGCKLLCEGLMQSIESHRLKLVEDGNYQAELQEKEAAMAFEIRRSIESTKTSKQQDDDLLDEDWYE